MARIPSLINGVVVELSPKACPDVDLGLIDGLRHCIKTDIAPEHALNKIYISSAADSHTFPSRHVQMKAVDISRINGIKIVIGYPDDPTVKAIVDAIQGAFETFPSRRENFGPAAKTKLGTPWPVSGHDDHIHLSIN